MATLLSIEIRPDVNPSGSPTLPVVESSGVVGLNVYAYGHYDNGAIEDVTYQVTWDDHGSTKFSVSNTGISFNTPLVKGSGAGAGSGTLTATLGAVSADAIVNVAVPPGAIPIIDNISPLHGKPGDKIVITGANFVGVKKVRFGLPIFITYEQAYFAVVNSTTLWVWVNVQGAPIDGSIEITNLTGSANAYSGGGAIGFDADDPLVPFTERLAYPDTGGAFSVFTPDGLNVWVAGFDDSVTSGGGYFIDGNIRRSKDGGLTWIEEFRPPANGFFGRFYGTATDLYLCVVDEDGNSYYHTNGSGTWTVVTVVATNDSFASQGFYDINGSSPDDLWAIEYGQHAVFHSADRGATWQHVHDLPDFGNQVSAPAPDNVWFACTDYELDHWDGAAWTEITAPFSTTFPQFYCLVADGQNVWAAGAFGGEDGPAADQLVPLVVYRSHDNGATWTTEMIDLLPSGNRHRALQMGKDGQDVWLVGVSDGVLSPAHDNIGNWGVIYRSVGGADNWTEVTHANPTIAFPDQTSTVAQPVWLAVTAANGYALFVGSLYVVSVGTPPEQISEVDPLADAVDYVSDWNNRLLGRLYEQFKEDQVINDIVTKAIAPQAQALEDSGQSLLSVLDIDNSAGAGLDRIGRIVGQTRAGTSDPTYRLYLRARVRANRSSGSPEDLYAVLAAIVGPGASLEYVFGGFASFALIVHTPISSSQAAVGVGFLRDSKDAGKRAILEWQQTSDALAFTFAKGSGLSAAGTAGDPDIHVVAGGGFPAAGQVTIDKGLAGEETIAYNLVSGDSHITFTSSTLANNHDQGAAVELVGEPGLGFGDSANPSAGGAFVGAAQA